MGVGGQHHVPAALSSGKRPGTHCIGGWVCTRAGLDRCGKGFCEYRKEIAMPITCRQPCEKQNDHQLLQKQPLRGVTSNSLSKINYIHIRSQVFLTASFIMLCSATRWNKLNGGACCYCLLVVYTEDGGSRPIRIVGIVYQTTRRRDP